MSIVKMRRLRLFAMLEDRDALLHELQHLGCVEIGEAAEKLTEEQWEGLSRSGGVELDKFRGERAALTAALDALNAHVPTKGGLFTPRPAVTEDQLFDESAHAATLEAVAEITRHAKRMEAIRAEQSKLKAQRLTLEPWLEVDRNLDHPSTEKMKVMPGSLPASTDIDGVMDALEEATELAYLLPVRIYRESHYVLLMCHRSVEEEALSAVKRFGFTRTNLRGWPGTPREDYDRLGAKINSLEEEWQAEKGALLALGGQRENIKLMLDRLQQGLRREQARERLLQSDATFFLDGWVTAPEEKKLTALLDGYTCAYELSEPDNPEEVPIKLKSNKLTYPVNMVTEMYSLPAYDGIDPNPLILPFFALFFGIMYADLGYGLVLIVIGLLAQKLLKPKGMIGQMMGLMVICGVTTAVMGFAFGGFFGDVLKVVYTSFLGVPEAQFPAWLAWFSAGPLFNPMDEPMKMMVFSLALGAVQIVTSQCIHMYMCIRDGEALDGILDVVPWWVFFGGIAYLVLGGGMVGLIIGVLALVLTQGRHEKNIFMKLFGGIKSLYGVTNYLSDILSYLRLMALVLATSVIASVVNMLGAMTGIVGFALIFLIGHAFNMAVNIIGTYVHAARLQYLEYFSRFYKEGGRPFDPLKIDTDYVDIVKEEQ
ncbi:MAG: V-type ATP synthase subunit I [Oscillospiraceae bacterium]|nr:V-type ATP synthase subunit I [Oscillospiraceae bacterium]